MRAQLSAAIRMVLVFSLVLGIGYPLAITAIAQFGFEHRADGSIVRVDGDAVGSELLGQRFTGREWFHPRPSAAGDGYDTGASAPSNYGPTNPRFLGDIDDRISAYRRENGLRPDARVPVDAVTASGSGLDPHISVANARLQARRIAEARGIPVRGVLELVGQHTDDRSLGLLGERGVNVLGVNLALRRFGQT